MAHNEPCVSSEGGKVVGDHGPGSGSFRCHPECLKRSYWRKVFLEVEEEIRGLRPGQFVELVLAVEEAEAETWWGDRPATRVGKRATTELYLRGWADGQIDQAFGFPHGATTRVVEESRVHAKGREVVAAHLNGDAPSRISRDHGVGIPTVTDILAAIGEEPHRIRDLARSADVNRAIQRRYEEGWSYKQIADHLGITEQKVRSRLQYLRKKGRIDQPVRPAARRRPRAAE